MKRVITVAIAMMAMYVPASAAVAEPIDACFNEDPDFHITVANTVETCGDYPDRRPLEEILP